MRGSFSREISAVRSATVLSGLVRCPATVRVSGMSNLIARPYNDFSEKFDQDGGQWTRTVHALIR